jgi:hypothetical protein
VRNSTREFLYFPDTTELKIALWCLFKLRQDVELICLSHSKKLK